MLQLRLISGISLVVEVVRLLKNLMKTEPMAIATGDDLTTVGRRHARLAPTAREIYHFASGFKPLKSSKKGLSVERIIWLSVLIDFS